MKRLPTSCLIAVALLATPALAEPVLPDFAAADFSTPKDHPYMPLVFGQTRTMMGLTMAEGETVPELAVRTVIGPGPLIMGVQSVTVVDEAFVQGRLVERTLDYFAADAAGNIWYLGEDVENFTYDEAGGLTGTDNHSAWLAGVNGGLPGITMPADLTVGQPLFQEQAPVEEAMDYAELVETGLVIDTAAGRFTDVIKFYEASTVDPDLREFKYYAPGVGMIRADEHLDEGRANPELIVELQP
jgi:hypothetical protein